MRRTNKTRIGILIREKRDGEYFHILGDFVTIGLTAWERNYIDAGHTVSVDHQKIRNCRSEELHGGLDLDSLAITSQGCNRTIGTDRPLYGFDVEYREVFAIDVRRAEKMARTLRTIDRRLSKLRDTLGPCDTFGAYVARVAQVTGATSIVLPDGPSIGWNYASRTWRFLTPGDGAANINHMARQWAKTGTVDLVTT